MSIKNEHTYKKIEVHGIRKNIKCVSFTEWHQNDTMIKQILSFARKSKFILKSKRTNQDINVNVGIFCNYKFEKHKTPQ